MTIEKFKIYSGAISKEINAIVKTTIQPNALELISHGNVNGTLTQHLGDMKNNKTMIKCEYNSNPEDNAKIVSWWNFSKNNGNARIELKSITGGKTRVYNGSMTGAIPEFPDDDSTVTFDLTCEPSENSY